MAVVANSHVSYSRIFLLRTAKTFKKIFPLKPKKTPNHLRTNIQFLLHGTD